MINLQYELSEYVYKNSSWREGLEPLVGIVPEYTTDFLLDKLADLHYNLRLEHNHSDMRWYVYYTGKDGTRKLFDHQEDWNVSGDTPVEALLRQVVELIEAGEIHNDFDFLTYVDKYGMLRYVLDDEEVELDGESS